MLVEHGLPNPDRGTPAPRGLGVISFDLRRHSDSVLFNNALNHSRVPLNAAIILGHQNKPQSTVVYKATL